MICQRGHDSGRGETGRGETGRGETGRCLACRREEGARARARRKAAGLSINGSKTWAPEKRAAWQAGQKESQAVKARRAEQSRAYARDPAQRHKHEARWLAQRAVLSGRLVKQPCRCGAVKVQAHHSDYSKPLEVVWLCVKCHRAEHAKAGL